MRELQKFGGGVSHSVFNPVVLIVVLIAGLLICMLPRSRALIPFLLTSILVPMDQIVLVGPFHFPMLRILILFGWISMVRAKLSSNTNLLSSGINTLDKVVISLTIVTALDWILLWQESATLIFQLGEIYNTFGIYFLLRFLIRDRQDIVRAVRAFMFITAILALIMVFEQVKGWNPYALLGGAQASFFSSVLEREGHYRSTGSFGHPILAGSFAAALVPMFIALWWVDRRYRVGVLLGVFAATVVVVTSHSSTPLMAYFAAALGLCMWPLRGAMRVIRWGIALLLVSLHIVMKAPVWHLISRIDMSGGSASYHRYELVNQFIVHFKDWWLFGVKYNGNWGWDMWDTANQYVNIGENSGLIPLLLFLAVIVYGFKFVGSARKRANTKKEALFVWALGSSLFANLVAFFGISYFDQTVVLWYTLLASISTIFASLGTQPHTAPTYALMVDPELQPS